jgi:hypothetical protein
MAQGKIKVSGKSKKPAHQQRKQAPIKGKSDSFYKKTNVNVTKVWSNSLFINIFYRKSTKILRISWGKELANLCSSMEGKSLEERARQLRRTEYFRFKFFCNN